MAIQVDLLIRVNLTKYIYIIDYLGYENGTMQSTQVAAILNKMSGFEKLLILAYLQTYRDGV